MTAGIFHDDLALNDIICDNVCGGSGEWSITEIHPAAEKKGMSLFNLLKDIDPNIQTMTVLWSRKYGGPRSPWLHCCHSGVNIALISSTAELGGLNLGQKWGFFFGVYHILCGTEAPTRGSISTRLIQGTKRTEIEKRTPLLWSLEEIFWLK